MTEYIKRKSVLTILDDYCVIDEAYNAVKALPAANVVEARHGKWIDCSNGWMRSECEQDNTYAKPWCPNCGARMDGKEDDHIEKT